MKQTAVEWLANAIEGLDTGVSYHFFQEMLEQAKEMEKQQIIEARVKIILDSNYVEAEEYYNETFKKEPYTNVQQKSLKLNEKFVNSLDSESLDNIMSEFDELNQEKLLGKTISKKDADKDSFEDVMKYKKEKMYSEEEVLNFTQTILMQYKFGNTNIEQMDLLRETFQLFKKK